MLPPPGPPSQPSHPLEALLRLLSQQAQIAPMVYHGQPQTVNPMMAAAGLAGPALPAAAQQPVVLPGVDPAIQAAMSARPLPIQGPAVDPAIQAAMGAQPAQNPYWHNNATAPPPSPYLNPPNLPHGPVLALLHALASS